MRVLPALALATTLTLGACQNPDGSLNVPASLALGAGVALAGVAIASSSDHSRRGYERQPRYDYGRPSYGYGRPSYGYDRGYRRY